VPSTERFAILAEGKFGPFSSKTANAAIRFTPDRVVVVLDSTTAGKTAQEVLGFGGPIPVVANIEEALALKPTALLIGIAPQGGSLPEPWRKTVREAIQGGLNIWSGLHVFIGDDREFAALAAKHSVRVFDLRRPPANLTVATGRVRETDATVVLTVGTDCNMGKMTVQLQILNAVRAFGHRVSFAATGQTGILIEGRGVAVDAVVADFVAGASEQLVLDCAHNADIVLVEGQGSLAHPGYSGVTLGLIHGSLPHAFVMCAQPSRKTISHNDWVQIPPLPGFIKLHEQMSEALRPAPVIAVALNTFDLGEAEALASIAKTREETGLPCTDPVRFDPAPIADAVHAFHMSRVKRS
jgi:uncharacterized NAD-dependent epimerase/dehydratase family protein